MTKQNLKKVIKRELGEIKKEYKISKWKKFGIDEDQTEIYNRGWYTAYNCILSMLEK